jgi:hypothetical protein
MRFFLDTEFHEDGVTIDLISIALVCEDGRELYLVSNEFNYHRAVAMNPWLVLNVFAKLPPKETWIPRRAIRETILDFIGPDKPEFWAYFADYDWVVLCQLFGKMIDLPSGWPMYCLDLKQEMHRQGITKEAVKKALPLPENAHDALADARWNRDLWEVLHGVEVEEEAERRADKAACTTCGDEKAIYCSSACAL